MKTIEATAPAALVPTTELCPPTATSLDLNGPATWDTVKHYSELASKFAHASVACQVMAGFGLLELRKAKGTNQGKRTDLATSPHDAEKLNWPDLVEKHAGISPDTASRWMAMAQGIRAKWKKLKSTDKLKQLMLVAPSEWNAEETKLVNDSLHKVADGQSQMDFMRALGLAKKPQGSGATGRAPGSKDEAKKLTISEEAALRKEQALKDWAGIDTTLTVYRDKFLLLTDAEVEAQCAVLEAALNGRKAWLKQPLTKRDPQAIAALFNTKL